MKDKIRLIICTAGGLGLCPYGPGTCGALLGVGIHLFIAYLTGPKHQVLLLVTAFFIIVSLHFLMNTWAESYWQEEDSRHFVLDEVAGYLIVPIFFHNGQPWQIALWGFLLFRILDIIKPPPAREIDERMKNALGVVLDDVVSAFYALILMYIGYYFLKMYN